MYGILRVYVSRHWVLIQQGQKRTSGTLVLGLTDGLSCHVITGTVNQGDSGRAAQALNCRIPAFFLTLRMYCAPWKVLPLTACLYHTFQWLLR